VSYDPTMSRIPSLMIERFKRLPRRTHDVWQGGLVRARTWVENPDGGVRRPWAAVWVSSATGMINMELAESDVADPSVALQVLVDLGLKFARCRPASLEMTDAALGAQLAEALGDPELAVAVRGDLPEVDRVLREAQRSMEEDGSDLPDTLDARGVTVERMRAFADAAREFYTAAPWQHLSDQDLIHVEAPAVAGGLRYVSVLGAARVTFGLGFFQSADEFEAVQETTDPMALLTARGKWSVTFGPLDQLPFGDADLWQDHGLVVAGPTAYPLAVWFGPDELRRPDARELADLEAILRAIARSTEAEIDRGRWTIKLSSHDGPLSVTLAIPELLIPLDAEPPRRGPADRRAMERVTTAIDRFVQGSDFKSLEEANAALRERFSGPMADVPSTATTPLEKAQDLMYHAFDARGRRRIQLARKALELSTDCADAFVVLAEESFAPETARNFYEQGVQAGERALGPDVFTRHAGRFWDILGTRGYLRARLGLAQSLEDLGRVDEAIQHYHELLRLNTSDNQGVRYLLLSVLLDEGRAAEALMLIGRFDEESALWCYGRALALFQREGDSAAARDALRTALRANRHVPQFLTEEADWPGLEPTGYSPGSREEAVVCDGDLGDAWDATLGAIDWLRKQAPARRSGKRRKR
jgi:tetratricopeptide (TPR) repeat protein